MIIESRLDTQYDVADNIETTYVEVSDYISGICTGIWFMIDSTGTRKRNEQ